MLPYDGSFVPTYLILVLMILALFMMDAVLLMLWLVKRSNR